MANMSAIYEYLGASPSQIPILWLAGPMTGLLIQPIIGRWSDRTWCKLGRRKPFFLVGAILASCALVLMPNSAALWMAAGLLWILDGSVNVSMGPFRAIVADNLNKNQMTKGYAVQSVLIAMGSVLASTLPYVLEHVFGFTQTVGAHGVPWVVKLSFYIGAGVFMVCILWTVFTAKEYPPEDMEAFNKMRNEKTGMMVGFKEMVSDLGKMPATMKQLAWVQVFAWMGLFCMFMYFPVTVARHVFGATEQGSHVYIEGVEWAGVCFGAYGVVCFFVSMVIPYITKILTRKGTFILCLLCGATGLISIYFIKNQYMLILAMAGVGVMYAGVMIIPYSILADVLPPEKMGVFMGVFNLFITIPEIIISLFFGWIMGHILGDNRTLGVVSGGICMIVSAILVLRVCDKGPEEYKEQIAA